MTKILHTKCRGILILSVMARGVGVLVKTISKRVEIGSKISNKDIKI